ncbi:MAG: pyridoxamine 5'-phosphate oxidase family protein [Candidatus Binataceae bacterium]
MAQGDVMSFHSGELEVQQRAGVREMADQVAHGIAEFVPGRSTDFLERRRMVVLGTVDSRSRAWASVVTGAPGFVSVPDPHTVRLGSLPPAGDPLIGNLARESHAALLAIDFLSPRRLRVNGQGIIQDGAIHIRTEQVYGNCRRYIQERMFFGSRPTGHADEATPARSSTLSAAQRLQISAADTFFIASDHAEQGADVSHKGGDPGFVRVIDARHISFPDYNGNNMFNTLGNIAVNPRAGLLFVDFDSGRTLQLSGFAVIDWSAERARGFAGAERTIDFEVEEIIDNSLGFPLLAKFRQFSRFNPKP